MILLVALGLALAQEPDSTADYRGYVDQARFQLRKGYLDAAAEDLERAAAHPDGRLDAEVWFMLAQVRLEMADLPAARSAAEQALTRSKDPTQESASAALLDALRFAYGVVRIESTQPGAVFRPKLVPAEPLLDPDQVIYLERLEKRLRKEPLVLPISLGLPVGSWTVNGEPVVISPDLPARMSLSVRSAGGPLAAARLAWLDVSAGLSFPSSSEDHLLPSPTIQAAFTAPIGGPWALGLVVQQTSSISVAADKVYRVDAGGLQAGLRVGPLLDDGERFLIRPTLGYRYGSVPDFELGCSRDSGGFVCGDGPAELMIYTPGAAHVGTVAVAADYLDRTGTSPVGGGVQVAADHAWVSLPKTGTARGAVDTDFRVEDPIRSTRRTTLHFFVNLSLAF